MFINLEPEDIKNSDELNKNFLSANLKEENLNCNIYKGNFYSDSFNYFIIDEKLRVYKNLFTRDINQSNDHFFSEKFFGNFKKNQSSLKEFKNIFLLGSNAANNYYSNLIQFLPRIFFLKNKKINLAIHRNSSIKFREFIKLILNSKKIEFKFVYLDDNFYKFTNSQIPQFFDVNTSIKILKKMLLPKTNIEYDKKIYVTREDSSYRKIINEADIVPILRSKGYKVINPQLYNIDEQIKIFSHADKIISPHGSNLTNIIFCKPGTKIFEIGPKFSNDFDIIFENRYKVLAEKNNLNYQRLITDTIEVKKHNELTKKYINNNILDKSNYYKNLIVKISDIDKLD